METLKTKVSSRKFWAAFLGSLMPIVCSYLAEDVALWDAIQASTGIIISYLFAQGAVDALDAKAAK